MDDYSRLVNCVKSLRTQNLTWQEIGDEIGISKALAWNVAHGKSDSVIARHYFGIPPKQVLVEPCRVCGEVHCLKSHPNPKDKGRYRVALEFKTKDEQQRMIKILSGSGKNRIEQSHNLLEYLE